MCDIIIVFGYYIVCVCVCVFNPYIYIFYILKIISIEIHLKFFVSSTTDLEKIKRPRVGKREGEMEDRAHGAKRIWRQNN